MLRSLSHRCFAVSAGTLVLSLALPCVAAAQSGGTAAVRDIHRLGGSTAFYKPPLTTIDSLKRMAGDPKVAANIRVVFGQAGSPDLTDVVVAALAKANSAAMAGSCSEANPAVGAVVECDVQPGQTLEWMAYRPKGNAEIGLLQRVRWEGQKPFRAYLFKVTQDGRTYTFVIPKVCGNLSLMRVQDVPRVAIAAPPPTPPQPLPAEPTPPRAPATLSRQASEPPPSQAPAPAPAASASASPFFIDALFGKERRLRPVEDTDQEFAQCSPLLGLKFGVAKRFQNDWELAGALGVALSMASGDNEVREHELFLDLEANKYLSGGTFLGTGLSLWDLTRSDTFTPAWMVHVGVPIAKHAKFPLYFLTEGRLFFDQIDDIQNNYQFWAGLRVHF